MAPEPSTQAAAWEKSTVPQVDYDQIAHALTSAESPVGIDAKHTHVLILHALDRIEKRLVALEERLGSKPG